MTAAVANLTLVAGAQDPPFAAFLALLGLLTFLSPRPLASWADFSGPTQSQSPIRLRLSYLPEIAFGIPTCRPGF
jgi:hypothetical protein